MHPFEYSRATSDVAALEAGRDRTAKFIAGGTNLLDLMKEHVETPRLLVDINPLPMSGVEVSSSGLRIGALARMSEVAEHDAVVRGWPVIAEALLNSASPQLRNMASMGGNLLQRTRCPYFRDITFACNKRNPGSGCPAIPGENRMHAILGTSDACIATHASDLAVALVALDARLRLRNQSGERTVALMDFYREPGTTPHIENVLQPGEMIVAIDVPSSPHAENSHYLKVRDRASYEFALTSAAVGLDLNSGTIRSARVALGGVGTRPWRSVAAEQALAGKPAGAEAFRAAAEAAIQGARPQRQNRFKVELARRTVIRALEETADRSMQHARRRRNEEGVA
jgi:xanthine dehydrogenase YagS FAD-binding subunit